MSIPTLNSFLITTNKQLLYFISTIAFRRKYSISSATECVQKYKDHSQSDVTELLEMEEKKQMNFGIAECVGKKPSLSGVIKQRFSHFIVNEIDLSGKRIQLTDLHLSEEVQSQYSHSKDKRTVLHCTLYKEGIGTAEAVLLIARKLRISPNRIKWSGRKDSRAETSQRISIVGINPRHLLYLSTTSRKIKLGNYKYCEKPLKFGELKGNHFQILLKNLKSSQDECNNVHFISDEIERNMMNLKENGFINYFGLQRFGGQETCEIGKAYLQMDWKKTIDLILAPNPYDNKSMLEAKEIWMKEEDPIKIMKMFPEPTLSKYATESHLFKGLAKYYEYDNQINGQRSNLLSAIHSIPKQIRSLYPCLYASYLWNKMSTFRLQTFGYKAQIGDYIYTVPPTNNSSLSPTEDCTWNWTEVRPLTQEDDLDKYSIFDVLLPVLGSKTSKFPNPFLQEYFQELLKSEGLDVDCFTNFKSSDIQKGSYRPIVVKPQNVSWKMIPCHSSENLDDVILSDLDLLNDLEFNRRATQKDNVSPDNDSLCAKIEFSLPAACYATMAIRQIAKIIEWKSLNGNNDTSS